jgi:hypothetical protein
MESTAILPSSSHGPGGRKIYENASGKTTILLDVVSFEMKPCFSKSKLSP